MKYKYIIILVENDIIKLTDIIPQKLHPHLSSITNQKKTKTNWSFRHKIDSQLMVVLIIM